MSIYVHMRAAGRRAETRRPSPSCKIKDCWVEMMRLCCCLFLMGLYVMNVFRVFKCKVNESALEVITERHKDLRHPSQRYTPVRGVVSQCKLLSLFQGENPYSRWPLHYVVWGEISLLIGWPFVAHYHPPFSRAYAKKSCQDSRVQQRILSQTAPCRSALQLLFWQMLQ